MQITHVNSHANHTWKSAVHRHDRRQALPNKNVMALVPLPSTHSKSHISSQHSHDIKHSYTLKHDDLSYLSYLGLSYLGLGYLDLSYRDHRSLALSYLALSYLDLGYLALSYLGLNYLDGPANCTVAPTEWKHMSPGDLLHNHPCTCLPRDPTFQVLCVHAARHVTRCPSP